MDVTETEYTSEDWSQLAGSGKTKAGNMTRVCRMVSKEKLKNAWRIVLRKA
jgi:hypothetical protein